MRKLFLLIVFVCSLPVALCYGQAAAYYNFRDPLHSIAAYHSSVYVEENKGVFYTLAQCIDSVNVVSPGVAYFNWGIRLSKWRIADGGKLRDTVVQMSAQDTTLDKARNLVIYRDKAKNNLVRLNDSVFLVLLTTIDTGGVKRVGIAALDTNGRMEWLKEYDKPSCFMPREGIYAMSFSKTPYGEWIVLAENTCNDRTSGLSFGDVALMKLDSNFNLLWTRLFPMPPEYNFTPSALLVEPDGYVMGVTLRYQYPNNFWNPSIDRSQLLRVDTSGVFQWSWASDINEHEGIADLIRTPDSGFVYCSGKGKLFFGGTASANYKFYCMAKKLDKNRQVQWQFVDTTAYDVARRILPLNNGDFLLTGKGRFDTRGDSNYYDYATLYRIDSGGRQLWRHKYMWDSVAIFRDGTLYDMAFCGGGDVIMTGILMDQSPTRDPTQNVQQAWIVKVDSNGCLGPNDPQCSPQAVEEMVLPTAGVQVYPNPTTGIVKVSIGTAAQMVVTDLSGRGLLSSALQTGTQELNLSALPSGLYLYRIQTNTGSLFTGKITKQ